jgi:hypothetical protein
VFDHIFGVFLGCPFTVTSLSEEFSAFTGPRINYSAQNFEQTFQVIPCGLLDEQKTRPAALPPTTLWEKETVLFPQPGNHIPFDLFAMTFYLLSRYEEWQSPCTDEHGRFLASASVAHSTHNLQRPWLDYVLEKFKSHLLQSFPKLSCKKHSFSFTPTIDIDMAYCYVGKPLWRQLLAAGKDLLTAKGQQLGERIAVLNGTNPDPYNCYDQLAGLHNKFPVIYFFLLGNYTDKDKNLKWNSKAMHKLVKTIAEHYQIGIHPSYYSSDKPELFAKEIKRLHLLSTKPIIHSRQHFLRMNYHLTCLLLIENGIEHEYSMGYAETIGFRASTARSFKFFDLIHNNQTQLTIHPFMLMDVTLKNYMELTVEEAMEATLEIIQQVKQVNGELISLWHNESLSEYGVWKGWSKVYEQLIKNATE